MKQQALQVKRQVTKHTQYLQDKFKEHASTAIIAAFSFLIAISWKDFIVKLVKENLKIELLEQYPYLTELYSAIIVTIIAIIGIAIVSSWATKDTKEEKDSKKK
tara:strand:+ start:359 stop:670 length:312 start_codon:yes stop_codon:yes gene_type:complete